MSLYPLGVNRLAPFAVLLPLLMITGCGAGSAGSATLAGSAAAPQTPVVPSAAPSPSALPTCPAATAPGPTWPAPIPADLPVPPSSQVTAVKHTPDGLTVVNFTTATSLRDGVLYLVKQLPLAGYNMGRGDAETTEADAPFNKGLNTRGVYRMVSKDACNTQWLLAITDKPLGASAAPMVAAHVGPSPSPLPFG